MQDCRLLSPWRMLVVGSSGCGKSTLIGEIVCRYREVLDFTPTKIYIAHLHDQPVYDEIIKYAPCPVELIKGLPSELVTEKKSLLIIDDLALEAPGAIKDWFIRKCHHFDTCCVCLNQTLFDTNYIYRKISLNANYLIIFKNKRDKSQINNFAKQFCPGNIKFLQEAYADATEKPYSYIFFDMQQTSNDLFSVRSSIFPKNALVYVSKNVNCYNGVEACQEKSS